MVQIFIPIRVNIRHTSILHRPEYWLIRGKFISLYMLKAIFWIYLQQASRMQLLKYLLKIQGHFFSKCIKMRMCRIIAGTFWHQWRSPCRWLRWNTFSQTTYTTGLFLAKNLGVCIIWIPRNCPLCGPSSRLRLLCHQLLHLWLQRTWKSVSNSPSFI